MDVAESLKTPCCFYANYKQQSTNSYQQITSDYTDFFEELGQQYDFEKSADTILVLTAKMVRDYCSGRSGQEASWDYVDFVSATYLGF